MRRGTVEEWVPAVAGGEGPKWPDSEKKGLPRSFTLHPSQRAGSAPMSRLLALAALSSTSFTQRKGRGRAMNAGLAPRTEAAEKVETAAHPASGL